MWTIVNNEAALDKALSLAKGTYQRNLLLGIENLSGSTLRGKARGYGGRYAQSRQSLLGRLREHGIKVGEERGPHGRRILTIG